MIGELIETTQQKDDFKRYFEIVRTLVEFNLKVRYRGSFLGVYWSLLNPLIMTGVYTSIFGAAFIDHYNGSIARYMLAAFTGLVAIHFYTTSTSQALLSVVTNGMLLNKIKLPLAAFPLAMVVAHLVQFCVGSLPLLFIVALVTSKNPLNAIALFFPVASLTMLCLGIGYIISALYVFFRDLPYFYEIVAFLLWISTPVFYPAEIVPQKIQPILKLNPLSSIIESIRQLVLSGQSPDLSLIFQSVLAGSIVLMIGWMFFQILKPHYMDLI
ncbi:ABC transporter permease [Spirulina sp. 06S082]|uniref:ABC transporter permease n=1 Tax=Spirulina sp. 06S082 TaxID=3110248 RepID=UPI002B2137A2|nr:ABC transporter permease [Spirulina sp. 06S082]MEA5468208.1 ABC transporter permease [Spirulina sp. 06S082]